MHWEHHLGEFGNRWAIAVDWDWNKEPKLKQPQRVLATRDNIYLINNL